MSSEYSNLISTFTLSVGLLEQRVAAVRSSARNCGELWSYLHHACKAAPKQPSLYSINSH